MSLESLLGMSRALVSEVPKTSEDVAAVAKTDVNSISRRTSRKKKFVCFKCGEPGHFARYCTGNAGGTSSAPTTAPVAEVAHRS